MKGIQFQMEMDYKGTKKNVLEVLPAISENHDYPIQYAKIWRVMADRVIEMNAKLILEFGTRDGFSTRIFSEALKTTGGEIHTVDINPPKEQFTEENIKVYTCPVEELLWSTPVDILYIDDWHNAWHLYYELNVFAKLAKVVMIHDVCLDSELLSAVDAWCKHNWMIYTVYPLNGCGLAVIEIEKSGYFNANEDKPSGEQ